MKKNDLYSIYSFLNNYYYINKYKKILEI